MFCLAWWHSSKAKVNAKSLVFQLGRGKVHFTAGEGNKP